MHGEELLNKGNKNDSLFGSLARMENNNASASEPHSGRLASSKPSCEITDSHTTRVAMAASEPVQNENNCTRKPAETLLGSGIAIAETQYSALKTKGKKCAGREPRQSIHINGKKRYPCPFPGCNKTFSTSGHSSRHSRIHTGEKPYRCTYPNCNAQFSRYDNSVQHYRTHLVSSKGSKRGRSKSKNKLSAEVELMNSVKPESLDMKVNEEPVTILKQPPISMIDYSESGCFSDCDNLAKEAKLGNCTNVTSSYMKDFGQDPSHKASNESNPAYSSLVTGSVQQAWSKNPHQMLRPYTNLQSFPRAHGPDHGNPATQAYPLISEEHAHTKASLDPYKTSSLDTRQPATASGKQILLEPHFISPYAMSSSNAASFAFQPRISLGSRLSPDSLLSRESRLAYGLWPHSDSNEDTQASRPSNFQLHKSRSMPSLLSLELPRSDSSHSLSKYSLSSGSPTLTPSPSFKGPSMSSNGKQL